MKTKTKLFICFLSTVLFIAWIIIVKTVDVGNVGPRGSSVGLSLINSSFHDLWHYDDCGYNKLWYSISKYIGYFGFAVVGCIGLFGLMQLIKRKSLKKVDKCILAVGGLYAVTVLFYVIFELVIVNYRPIIMPGKSELEASFPSSHTLMIMVIFISVMLLLKHYMNNSKLKLLMQFVCLIIIIAGVLGRVICGVHWFSDIIGGMLLASALLAGFAVFNQKSFDNEKK